MTTDAWDLPDDVLFPAMLLQFGPPPKKGLKLLPPFGSLTSPKYVRIWGQRAYVYRNLVDRYLKPLANEVLNDRGYKSGHIEMKIKWRRNQYLIWAVEARNA